MAHQFAFDHKDAELSFELIGKKGVDYFRKRCAPIAGTNTDKFRKLKYADAEAIANSIIDVLNAAR